MSVASPPIGRIPADYPGREEVRAYFTERAGELDRGESDVRPGLRLLGQHDLISHGMPGEAGDLPTMLLIVEDVAAGCMSSGFALWAQRMTAEYLGQSRPRTDERLRQLRAGERVGSTAMAAAMKQLAGLDPVPVRATRTDDGVRLNGPIRWASNLFPDTLVVVPALYPDGSGTVVLLNTDDPGVTVHNAPTLLGLSATASSSVTLSDVEIPADAVLTDDLETFVRRIRPTFLLIQSAFCSGLTGASLAESAGKLVGLNAEFSADHEQLTERHRSVRERLFAYGADPASVGSADLLRLRLDAAEVAGSATRLESTVAGGAGYVAKSATSRRLREAAFLPVQSPTEGQLRWELSRCA